jgi:hypothetical protein
MFNQEKADEVCRLLEEGKSLRAASLECNISPNTILDWKRNDELFAVQYTRAREIGYQLLADEIIEISDEKEIEAKYQGEEIKLDLSANSISRNRLRVDTRKWMLSKMLPKVYGDKLELSGDPDKPLHTVARIELVALGK